MRTEPELVTLALAGDADAYGELVARYMGTVHGLAYAIVGPADADDLAQEALLRAFLRLDQLRDPAAFAGWLRRVTVTTALNHLAAHRPERLRSVELDLDLDAIDDAPSPHELVETKELADAALAALDALPARYRVPLAMFYLDGASYDAMTAMLGKPLGTVKSLVSRARDLLRDAVARRLELDLSARRLPPEVPMTIAAILKAAQAGDADEVRRLLGRDRSLAAATGDHDKTPLHWAAERGHREVAEVLLAHGADIEARTSWGATALEWAVNLGSAEVARLLLARGASGMNLWIAAGLGDLALVDTELARVPIAGRSRRSGDHWPADAAVATGDVLSDAMYIACRNGHTRAAERLLDAGANIDAKGYFGGRGVHWAAINGHVETVEMLARRGADLSVADDHFASNPAGWATEGGHPTLAARIVELGGATPS
jgi:RNA polymerase sigma-70 factor (ECF subfamily)